MDEEFVNAFSIVTGKEQKEVQKSIKANDKLKPLVDSICAIIDKAEPKKQKLIMLLTTIKMLLIDLDEKEQKMLLSILLFSFDEIEEGYDKLKKQVEKIMDDS